MEAIPTKEKEYCNVAAMALGLDPAGYAGGFDDAIIMETPLPWKREIYQTAGVLPQQVIDLLALWLERYKSGQPYNHRPLMIAPDPEYARDGFRRVIFYRRAAEAFARFDKQEYFVPDEQVGALAWALYEARDQLSAFERYQVPEADKVRDILVCTHGTIDVACAKFGYPLYRNLRDTYADDDLRVWRVSHFGGHVFAPTLMDMPTGHYWAYIEEAQADQIIRRTGDVGALRGHYRGWAGMGRSFAQVAERELWQREGWDWFEYAKCGEIVAQDRDEENPQWADVQINYQDPDRGERRYQAHVVVSHTVETVPTTGRTETYSYPQYSIKTLEQDQGANSSSTSMPNVSALRAS